MSHPRLSPTLVLSEAFQQRTDIVVPTPAMLALPEKVLQFGTGGFLRGFCDYFIDEANRSGDFAGRVVMVGSTGSERTQMLNDQGGLYTLRIQGLDAGEIVEQYHVVGSVSRVLAAGTDWTEVMMFATSPDLELIISNTTEVGVVYSEEPMPDPDIAPVSFPAKLTAVLATRALVYNFDPARGVVVLPCELIDKNGATLEQIVRQLAADWNMDQRFFDWLDQGVRFCNTLVDRIVPGAPSPADLDDIEARLRFEDAMITTAEVYRLWPIETDVATQQKLTFANADENIVLTDDVHPYKERKVRILNGAHTASVHLAFLAGEKTVLSMMRNPLTYGFVDGVMNKEIVPSLDVDGGGPFARQVVERFSNPFLRHRLVDITLQSTSKWRLRLLPSMLSYIEKNGELPRHICFGFAAYLVFMRVTSEKDGTYFGERAGKPYPIRDDQAGYFAAMWESVDSQNKTYVEVLVSGVCAKEAFWGQNLNKVNGFVEAVTGYVLDILSMGAERALQKFTSA